MSFFFLFLCISFLFLCLPFSLLFTIPSQSFVLLYFFTNGHFPYSFLNLFSFWISFFLLGIIPYLFLILFLKSHVFFLIFFSITYISCFLCSTDLSPSHFLNLILPVVLLGILFLVSLVDF